MKHVKAKNSWIFLLISSVVIVLQYRINSLESKYSDLKHQLRLIQNNIEHISLGLNKDTTKETPVNQEEDFNNAVLESLGAKLPVIQTEFNNNAQTSGNTRVYKDANEESEWRYLVSNQTIKIPVPYAQIQAGGRNFYKFKKSDIIFFDDGSKLTF